MLLERCEAYAFNTWVEWAAEQRSLKQRMAHVVRRLVHRTAISALHTWADFAADAVGLRRKVLELFSGQLSRSLAASFGDWHQWAVEHKRVSRILDKAARKMYRSLLVSCMDAWVDHMLWLGKMKRAVMLLMRRSLVVSFLALLCVYTALGFGVREIRRPLDLLSSLRLWT